MFNTPKSVKSLRAYYKDRLAAVSDAQLMAELNGESDRAAVILASSILDDVLTFRLCKSFWFSPDEQQFNHAFRSEGPLGTFSARIELAFLFGFIDELTRSQLDDIREMRNACAHSHRPIDFSVLELANVAKRLFHPRGVATLNEHTRAGIKGAFIMEFAILYHILLEGSRKAGIAKVLPDLGQPPEPPPPPDQPTQR